MYNARVIARQGDKFVVENKNGKQIVCHARNKATETVCGDFVTCKPQNHSLHVIESILKRKNQLTRIDNFNRHKTVAANIDHMVIVVAPVPNFSELIIDKYLACAQLIDCDVSLIVNKCEILAKNDISIEQVVSTYENLCANICVTSAKLGYGITKLRGLLRNQYSIFVGQSGVGKSSLINRLLNSNRIKVANLSRHIQKGTHTTTQAWAHSIDEDTKIIDSPGVRSFTPVFDNVDVVMHGFKEFLPLIAHCKFSNCLHLDEPQCAIKTAVESKLISSTRYDSYVNICQELVNK